MKIGRRIYYELSTGNVIVDTGEREASVVATNATDDIATYYELKVRLRSTFDFVQLPYGAYAEDFRAGGRCSVDLKTKQLKFIYPDKPAAAPSVPLSESVRALADENADLLMQNAMQDVSITSLQDENAALMMRLAMLEMGGPTNV